MGEIFTEPKRFALKEEVAVLEDKPIHPILTHYTPHRVAGAYLGYGLGKARYSLDSSFFFQKKSTSVNVWHLFYKSLTIDFLKNGVIKSTFCIYSSHAHAHISSWQQWKKPFDKNKTEMCAFQHSEHGAQQQWQCRCLFHNGTEHAALVSLHWVAHAFGTTLRNSAVGAGDNPCLCAWIGEASKHAFKCLCLCTAESQKEFVHRRRGWTWKRSCTCLYVCVCAPGQTGVKNDYMLRHLWVGTWRASSRRWKLPAVRSSLLPPPGNITNTHMYSFNLVTFLCASFFSFFFWGLLFAVLWGMHSFYLGTWWRFSDSEIA